MHECVAGCGATFLSSSGASLHYAEQHLGREPRATRPVSCWACAAYIPTVRQPDGSVSFGACPECGWLHPQARTS